MSLKRQQLARVIAAEISAGRFTAHQVRSIAAFLLRTGQVGQLSPLIRDVNLERAKQGSLEVATISAHPLSAAVLRDIRAEAKKLYPDVQRVHITQAIDPAVIGGVRVTMGGYELDLSVRTQLQRLTVSALGGNS